MEQVLKSSVGNATEAPTWWSLVAALLLVPIASASQLSLEETLGLAQSKNWRAAGAIVREQLDARAKNVLKSTFDEIELRFQSSAIGIIGTLADSADDVKFVEARVITAGQLTTQHTAQKTESSTFFATLLLFEEGMRAIAAMAQSGIPEAKELLLDMCNVSYWRELDIEIPSVVPDVPYNGLFIAACAVAELFPSEVQDVHDFLLTRLASADISLSSEQRGRLARVPEVCVLMLPSQVQPNEDMNVKLQDTEYRAYLRRLGSRPLSHPRTLDSELLAHSPAQRAEPILDRHGTLKVELKPVDSFEDREEALAAFSEIRQMLLDGEYTELFDRLLVGGEPVSHTLAMSWRTNQREYAKVVEKLQADAAVLDALPDDLAFGPAKSATIDEGDTLMLIAIQGSSSVAQQVIPHHDIRKNSSYPTTDPSGNLVIVMRRVDGEYYWNPFSF